MSNFDADLRAYYEAEASLGTRTGLRGRRIEFRDEFISRLRDEGATSVVDFGAGPGHDGIGFLEAGISYLGLDLAHGNGLIAAQSGVNVVQGSIKNPPFRRQSFSAGWSMSTIMHLPDADVPQAVSAMADSLRPGGLFGVGLWGASSTQSPRDEIDAGRIQGQRRLFSLRSFDRNHELFSASATIEQAAAWEIGTEGWLYHVFVLRV